jgi:hypothetical protein
MRWIAVIVAGWVVLTFIVGVLVGHMLTRRPQVQRSEHSVAPSQPAVAETRTKRPA